MRHEAFDRLEESYEALGVAAAELRLTKSFWVADLAFLGYLEELIDNAEAVQTLVAAAPPLHAMPSARATFEAAQHLLMLATAPEPAHAGALAYVYGILKDHEILETHSEELIGTLPEDGGIGWDDHALDEIALEWDRLSTGRGALIAGASAELRSRWRRKPDHWSGLNPASELGRRLSAASAPGGSVREMFSRAYRALNRETHPRTVVRPKTVIEGADGGFHTTVTSRDPESSSRSAAWITAAALNLALRAIAIRREAWAQPNDGW